MIVGVNTGIISTEVARLAVSNNLVLVAKEAITVSTTIWN